MENILTNFELERNRVLAGLDTELDRIESVLKLDSATEDDIKKCYESVDMMCNVEKRLNGFVVNNRLNNTRYAVKTRMSKFEEERELKKKLEKRAELSDRAVEFEKRVDDEIDEPYDDVAKKTLYTHPSAENFKAAFERESISALNDMHRVDSRDAISDFIEEIEEWRHNFEAVLQIYNATISEVPDECM